MNNPRVNLIGEDGDAFAILAACKNAAKRAGWPESKIQAFLDEAKSGSYEHLLVVVYREFDVM